jgi:hypothetical protein
VNGEAFRENVRTLVINTHGAKIATYHQLALGAEILIENPALVRSVKATVVWLGKKPAGLDPYEVGLQLFEAQNIWGIEFPPDDWQAESSAVARLPETAKVPPPAGGKLGPGRTPAPALAKPAEVAPREPVEVPGGSEAALRRFDQLATEAAERHSVLFGEKLTKVMSQIGLQTQTRLQDEARQLQEKTIRAMEQEVNALTARLQSTYGKVEALLSKSFEIEKSSRAHLEKTQERLKEASHQAVEGALEESKKKARHEFEILETDSVKQLRQRLEREVSTEMESFQKASAARLTALTDEHLERLAGEFQTRQVQALKDTQKQLRDAAEATSAQFQRDVCKPAEAAASSLRAEVQKAGEEAVRALQQLQHQAQEVRKNLEKDLARSGEGLIKEIRGRLEEDSKELLGASLEELQQAAGAARERLKKELSESGRELLAETAGRVADLVNSSVDSLSAQALAEFRARCAQVTDEHFEALGKQLENSKGALVEAVEQKRSHLEACLAKAEAASASARESLDRQAAELTQAALQRIGQESTERAEQWHARLEDFVEQIKAASQAARESLAEQAEELRNQLGVAKAALAEWEGQMRGHLETHLGKIEMASQTARATLEKRGEDLMQAAVERIRQETETLANQAAEDFRAKLAEVFATLHTFGPKPGGRQGPPSGESKRK